MSKRIAIIGAGPSGLLTAYFLKKQKYEVVVFEKSNRAGGWIHSERKEGRLIEWGPHTLLARPDWLQLFAELNLRPINCNLGAKRRFIYKNKKLIPLPSGLISFLTTELFSPSAKLGLVTSVFERRAITESDLSIADFFGRFLHQDFIDYAVDPFISGIYSGDIHKLSAKACFPKIWDAVIKRGNLLKGAVSSRQKASSHSGEKRVRALPISFSEGLEEIARALERELKSNLRKNTEISQLHRIENLWSLKASGAEEKFDSIIVACPSWQAAEILATSGVSDLVTRFLRDISYRRVAIWNAVFDRPANFKSGFGFLIPRKEKLSVLGSLWPSEIFSGRTSKDELITTQYFAGEDIPQDPAAATIDFLQKTLGLKAAPKMSEVRVHQRAIPQFMLRHKDQVQKVRSLLPQNLILVGNYLDGVGLSDVIQTAKSAVEAIKKE